MRDMVDHVGLLIDVWFAAGTGFDSFFSPENSGFDSFSPPKIQALIFGHPTVGIIPIRSDVPANQM